MGAGRKKSTGTDASGAPLTPRYTSVDYGPLVAQSLTKRFGRSQTILGGAGTALGSIVATRELRTLLGSPGAGDRRDAASSAKPGMFASFNAFAQSFKQSPTGTLLAKKLVNGKSLLGG